MKLDDNLMVSRACPLTGSGYAVLPSVGAAHHALWRVPTIPHAGSVQKYTFLAIQTDQKNTKNRVSDIALQLPALGVSKRANG
jgi:hypothetical protein